MKFDWIFHPKSFSASIGYEYLHCIPLMVLHHHTKNQLKRSSCSWDTLTTKIFGGKYFGGKSSAEKISAKILKFCRNNFRRVKNSSRRGFFAENFSHRNFWDYDLFVPFKNPIFDNKIFDCSYCRIQTNWVKPQFRRIKFRCIKFLQENILAEKFSGKKKFRQKIFFQPFSAKSFPAEIFGC